MFRHDFSLKPKGPMTEDHVQSTGFPHEIHHFFPHGGVESFLAFLNLPESKVYGEWSSVNIIFPMTSMAILWLLTVHLKIAGEPPPKRRETNSSAPSLGSSAATSHCLSAAEKLGQKNLEKVEKTHHVMVISYDLMVILHGFIEIPMLMLGKIDTLTIRN